MKKIYSSPRLTEHGDIRTLTQGELAVSAAEGLFQKKPDPTS